MSPVAGPTAQEAADGARAQSAVLYIPATDIGPLLNIRKNNIPGYISKYDSSLRQQMMVDCPRAAGGIARVQLNVLTIAGAEKFIMTSRSKQAEKVWTWIQQHVTKIQSDLQQQQHHLPQSHSAAARQGSAGARLAPSRRPRSVVHCAHRRRLLGRRTVGRLRWWVWTTPRPPRRRQRPPRLASHRRQRCPRRALPLPRPPRRPLWCHRALPSAFTTHSTDTSTREQQRRPQPLVCFTPSARWSLPRPSPFFWCRRLLIVFALPREGRLRCSIAVRQRD